MTATDVGTADVARAAGIARQYHRTQKDKSGRPYFEAHVADVHRRVAEERDAVQVVALLHDVLEDTGCTEAELRGQFPADVVDAVLAITHHPDESRVDYYKRVRANPLALAVKLADIASNTDPARMALLDQPTRSRLRDKYRTALTVLGEADPRGAETRG
jgi:(p)ppGpp synthase/HD superfamily hydrolase